MSTDTVQQPPYNDPFAPNQAPPPPPPPPQALVLHLLPDAQGGAQAPYVLLLAALEVAAWRLPLRCCGGGWWWLAGCLGARGACMVGCCMARACRLACATCEASACSVRAACRQRLMTCHRVLLPAAAHRVDLSAQGVRSRTRASSALRGRERDEEAVGWVSWCLHLLLLLLLLLRCDMCHVAKLAWIALPKQHRGSFNRGRLQQRPDHRLHLQLRLRMTSASLPPIPPSRHCCTATQQTTHLRSTLALPPLSRYIRGSMAKDARRRSEAMSARGSELCCVTSAELRFWRARVRSSTALMASCSD